MKTATSHSPSAEVDPLIVGGMRLRTSDVLKRLGRLNGRNAVPFSMLSDLHAELNTLLQDTARLMSARAA